MFLYESHVLDWAQFTLALEVDTVAVMFLAVFGLFGDQLNNGPITIIFSTIVQLFERCVIIEDFIFLLIFDVDLHFSTNWWAF